MKWTTHFAAVLCLTLTLLSNPLLHLSAQAADDPWIIWDFRSQMPTYGYEGWEDFRFVGQQDELGVKVDAGSRGGFGIVFDDPKDFTGYSHLIVKVVTHNGHTDHNLHIKVHTTDGRFFGWTVPVDSNAEVSLKLDLEKPEFTDENLEGTKLDMATVKQIQFQGSFDPQTNFAMQFMEVGLLPKN